ncbi:trypsin-like peptidase domain-containing protein [Oculatella sp. LEGE 06141]|uniref:HhoA/HhoB/HtrA family serine endopeptidase n=1 Tax=Oculatella sp. LEGE 06141 TaxID=1828648 RepID=UPI00187DE5B8|nr:HhoA/HhoB/HtrA family serine endopeptidase [Oculatella sp. LEGE 06141]MBE9179192.1 trypsin-like peptidase domain-containing protein [Oculatella sp. LEGE 06141]
MDTEQLLCKIRHYFQSKFARVFAVGWLTILLLAVPVSSSWAKSIATPGFVPAFNSESADVGSTAETLEPIVAQAPAATVRAGSFVAAAVERVGPAVVRIDTERTITRTSDPLFNDPFFRRFFGDGMMPQGPSGERLQGQGSGFIVDGSGVILTNAHVVDRADRVTVRLKDGRAFDGEVRGADEVTDLAVVKINVSGGGLPVAPLGDSDEIQVGDWAIAVGNPLGLDNTVTLGIVSTLNRSSAMVGIPDKRLEFIQTDAAINPGNSGGPLLNDRGEVIGINTAIRANANGIGFAIPVNKAKEITDQLVRGESVQHPYLGVQIATLTPDLAKQNNDDINATVILPEVNGVLVMGVIPNSPAAQAGIRRGDVIVQIDGQPVTSADRLQLRVDSSRVGQPLRLTIRRGDRTQQISVRTAALPSPGRNS